MLINEVVVKEAYREDLLIAVQDLLTYAMKRNIAKISTEKFKSALAKQGYVASTEEIISAVDMSGFASSVNADEIIPTDQLSGDIDTKQEPTVDVSAMAGSQALKDIKADL